MILRKPYAFLIKYFRKINILLLLLVVYIFYSCQKLYQFVNEYLSTTVYNKTIDSITNYINSYIFISLIVIIIISGILLYLLKRKDKPYFWYLYILIVNFLVLCLFIYTKNYFTYTAIKTFDLVNVRVINDLTLIATIPYYPMLFILIIRAIGLDLKSFGFQEDKEFLEINEKDREEVEVQVAFNKDKLIRKIKNKFRYTKYFFLEHKVVLSIVFVVVLMIFGFNFYNYFYVENRVYNMNEDFKSNNYVLKVNHTYLTDKDYSGNTVSEDGTYFILVDISITNLLSTSRDFDIEKVLLFINNDYYVPTTNFNSYFTDMGNLYDGKSITANSSVSYLLVYEVPKPDSDANFLLKYQDLTSGNGKLINVKMKIQDISAFKEKGSSKLNELFTIPINLDENISFNITSYELLDSVNYTYQQCSPKSCPIYQDTVSASTNNKILYIKFNLNDTTKEEFLNFIYKYGKLRYKVGGEYITTSLRKSINKSYRGNYLYLTVNSNIMNVSDIELIFTIRSYQYIYKLKGE